jgi:hydrogenase-4 component B
MDADGWLLVLLFALCGAGSLVGLIVHDRRNPVLLAWSGALAAAAAAALAVRVLWTGAAYRATLWTIPPFGALSLAIDRLSALFLLVAAAVVMAAAVFSAGYLERYAGQYSLKSMTAWFLLLFASIVLILAAGDALSFLLAWEAMSVLSYLLVAYEHRHHQSSQAGYLMLAMGEAGFLAVVMVFLFLAARAGALDFPSLKAAAVGLGPVARWLVFLLTFFGFGVKAGLVPVNSWLPRAHPAAPANVSAVLSGVILNLGLYGIVRVNFDLVPVGTAGPGIVVLVVGTLSALIGILYAATENDLKAMLAYSSIENIGIVTAGLGACMVFSAYGLLPAAGIALTAAFYHMVNHSMYKGLLFLGAGTVDARTGTRDLNRLGGLARALPWTSGAMLIGALSIAALPPFNGFVSEWLTLQTMLRSVELPELLVKIVFALCGAALALTAALAVTCFVKMYAMGFLGMARSESAARATEAPRSSRAPLVALAAACVLLGALPTYVIPALDRTLEPWSNGAGAALVPPFFAPGAQLPAGFVAEFHDLGAQVGQGVLPGPGLVVLHRGGQANPVVFAMSTSYMLVVLAGLLGLTWVVLRLWLTRARRLARGERWAGGLRRLLPEMTYTATGFSNPVRVIFDAVFRPTTVADTRETVAEHFRNAIMREREAVPIADRIALQPLRRAANRLARRLAAMHHGRINAYAAYVLVAIVLAFVIGLT